MEQLSWADRETSHLDTDMRMFKFSESDESRAQLGRF